MPISLKDILESHRTGRAVVMGILNVTPDSFFDGGKFMKISLAVERARKMADAGADIIDIGAESTRPGSKRVSADEQINRLGGIIREIAALDVKISIDTTLAPVARFALDNEAHIINDVSAGTEDRDMLTLAAKCNCPVILMHMPGQPCDMQKNPQYQNVTQEVIAYLQSRINAAQDAGVNRENIIVDPGIGFGKTLEHNIKLVSELDSFKTLDRPILLGISQKRCIGDLTGKSIPAERTAGTLAACLAGYAKGATIFRVHDVDPMIDALKVFTKVF